MHKHAGGCCYCAKPVSGQSHPTKDHIVPLSAGLPFASDTIENMASCCKSCNSSKNRKSGEAIVRWFEERWDLISDEVKAKITALIQHGRFSFKCLKPVD